ncbi:hypothetical protein [Acetivibrio ethanolgignens]|uniref:Helix-turn-helix domain-containing protein n=1 Tax=Acetivibrio ethanolgignens TaxID=290052 RepID=A0A0V8QA50_9FIRM|nr:hypothetical protein [Acetivibrio ethanolgignens]KSV57399.1 hypothetical protein ASU35_16345 [Acetivibrio ethanolgignens]
MKEIEKEKENIDINQKILSQADLYKILPFGKTKIKELIKAEKLPLVKIGNDYITTFNILENWIKENIGEEIYY